MRDSGWVWAIVIIVAVIVGLAIWWGVADYGTEPAPSPGAPVAAGGNGAGNGDDGAGTAPGAGGAVPGAAQGISFALQPTGSVQDLPFTTAMVYAGPLDGQGRLYVSITPKPGYMWNPDAPLPTVIMDSPNWLTLAGQFQRSQEAAAARSGAQGQPGGAGQSDTRTQGGNDAGSQADARPATAGQAAQPITLMTSATLGARGEERGAMTVSAFLCTTQGRHCTVNAQGYTFGYPQTQGSPGR